MHPPKLARNLHISLEEAEKIYTRYHTELYPGVSQMKTKVVTTATKEKRIHAGLGCYMNTSNIGLEERTVFNFCSQFWSILTLLTINKLNKEIENSPYKDDIVVVSTIYDSIYLHLKKDANVIKWLNDTIIPIMTKDFLTDMIVQNKAVGDLSPTWCDGIEISNGASLEEINEALVKLESLKQ